MKPLILSLLLCAVGTASHGQRAEFTIYPNGLIYDDATIGRLRSIADSLQQKFSTCPLAGDYYAIRQGRAHYIKMNSGDIKAAVADIQGGIGYEDFVKKYPSARVDSFVLVTEKDVKDDYNHRTIVTYTDELYDGPATDAYFSISHNSRGEIFTEPGDMAGENANRVFFSTYLHGYNKQELRAFYFLQPPSSPKIPAPDAQLIFYTDYMIDTTTGIFYKDAWQDGPLFEEKRPAMGPAQTLFRQYLDRQTDIYLARNHWEQPERPYFIDSARRAHRIPQWFTVDSLKRAYIRDSLPRFAEFQRLLSQAVPEALSQKGFTDDVFEDFTAQYYSSSAALAMKRNRRKAYMDNFDAEVRGPVYDMNIAILAAKSANWPVFLKAHLNFMGFDYRGQRMTCVKELEAMDIRVPDLLLGIGLQTIHPAENHPWGSISNLGRDLAEVTDKQALEKEILAMIRDQALDDYNRLRLHYLFLNYLFFLFDKDIRLDGLRQLEEADKMLPAYLAAKIKTDPAVTEK
jgi:hypothetical protein